MSHAESSCRSRAYANACAPTCDEATPHDSVMAVTSASSAFRTGLTSHACTARCALAMCLRLGASPPSATAATQPSTRRNVSSPASTSRYSGTASASSAESPPRSVRSTIAPNASKNTKCSTVVWVRLFAISRQISARARLPPVQSPRSTIPVQPRHWYHPRTGVCPRNSYRRSWARRSRPRR